MSLNFPKIILKSLLGKRLSKTSGKLEVEGVSGPVTINRDGYGIPYIHAENTIDAWYGLGFCQGQDRMFQLEMLLRIVRGTLAELIGSPGVAIDRFSRRVGFHYYARRQIKALDPVVRQTFEAFAKGVTEGTSIGCSAPAPEFALLRAKPTSFESADVLAGMNYISLGLSNWTAKLSRLVILQKDGPEALSWLDSEYAFWIPVTKPVGMPSGESMELLAEELTRFDEIPGIWGGSNNWAISPSRTVTQRPILANDPHLPPSVPPPWYLARFRTPECSVAGASFVGAPLIPSGHNGIAAWGVTGGFADNVDLYLEELGLNGESVREGEEFVPSEVRREIIQVKGDKSIEEKILVTRRGPVISPVLEGDLGAISMRATWMEPRSMEGYDHFHFVKNFDEFRIASVLTSPTSLNMVYADSSGNIGWQLIGPVPQRRKAWGALPLPGWDREFAWEEDPIPAEDMPHLFNPETGFVATANNKPVLDEDGPYLGRDWAEGCRQARIVHELGKAVEWDLDRVKRLQLDQLSVPWREIRETVLNTPGKNENSQEALRILELWDGVVAADSSGASVYEFFLAEMTLRLVQTKAPNAVEWVMGKGFNPLVPRSFIVPHWISHLSRLLREQPEGWFESSWEEEIAAALNRAVSAIKEVAGDSPDGWAWGNVRPLTLLHPLGNRPPLNQVFNVGPFPWGGDGQTVAQTGRILTDLTANPPVIANMRMSVDVGNWEENQFVLAGGQSGNPFSPHYSDQLPLWQRGEGISLAWSEENEKKIVKSTLRLNPLLPSPS